MSTAEKIEKRFNTVEEIAQIGVVITLIIFAIGAGIGAFELGISSVKIGGAPTFTLDVIVCVLSLFFVEPASGTIRLASDLVKKPLPDSITKTRDQGKEADLSKNDMGQDRDEATAEQGPDSEEDPNTKETELEDAD